MTNFPLNVWGPGTPTRPRKDPAPPLTVRELEHHAPSRPAAATVRRAIEIAGAVGNQGGLGINPVAAARKTAEGMQHRLGPARRELEHHAVILRAARVCCAIEIAGAVGNQAVGTSPVDAVFVWTSTNREQTRCRVALGA